MGPLGKWGVRSQRCGWLDAPISMTLIALVSRFVERRTEGTCRKLWFAPNQQFEQISEELDYAASHWGPP